MDCDNFLKKDGGRDIKASRSLPSQAERLVIECKRYDGVVKVMIIRQLYGVVSDEKVNKGVPVTAGSFTKGAQEFAERNNIGLIDGDALVLLLNEPTGSN